MTTVNTLSDPIPGAVDGQDRGCPDQGKALEHHILGVPGRDNAVFLKAMTGQETARFLFDCGADCLSGVATSDLMKLDILCFSHLHIDHVAGFDHLLRCTYGRSDRPLQIFGPPETGRIIGHRLCGILWDRTAETAGRFIVHDIHDREIHSTEFRSAEGFGHGHPLGTRPRPAVLHTHADFEIEALTLDHGTPSIAYLVRQKEQWTVDTAALEARSLGRGKWLRRLKDAETPDDSELTVDGQRYRVGDLRQTLIRRRVGESFAYLTDFRLTPDTEPQLVALLRGCGTVVCENNFADADRLLAERSGHLTSSDVGRLAAASQPKQIILFHLSDRYDAEGWRSQLTTVRQHFKRAFFPRCWNI